MDGKTIGRFCRICLEKSTPTESFPNCYPCRCSGSLKYVHMSCLDRWLSTYSRKTCELCGCRFRLDNLLGSRSSCETSRSVGLMRRVLTCGSEIAVRLHSLLFSFIVRFARALIVSSAYHKFFSDGHLHIRRGLINGCLICIIHDKIYGIVEDIFGKIRVSRARSAPCSGTPKAVEDNVSLSIGSVSAYKDSISIVPDYDDDIVASDTSTHGTICSYGSCGYSRDTSLPGSVNGTFVRYNVPIEDSLSQDGNRRAGELTLFDGWAAAVATLWYYAKAIALDLLMLAIVKSASVLGGSFSFRCATLDSFGLTRHVMIVTGLAVEFVATCFLLKLAVLFTGFLSNRLGGQARHNATLLYGLSKVAFFSYVEDIVVPVLTGVLASLLAVRWGLRVCIAPRLAAHVRRSFLFISFPVAANYAIGISIMKVSDHLITMLRKLYRPGALYFVHFESKSHINEILHNQFIYDMVHHLLIFLFYLVVSASFLGANMGRLSEIEFAVGSYAKLALYAIVAHRMLLCSGPLLSLILVCTRMSLVALAKMLDCSDYFFGSFKYKCDDPQSANSSDIQCMFDASDCDGAATAAGTTVTRLFWFPSRDRFYGRNEVRNVHAAGYSVKDYLECYLGRNDNKSCFSLFYIPRYFWVRATLAHVASFALMNLLLKGVLSLVHRFSGVLCSAAETALKSAVSIPRFEPAHLYAGLCSLRSEATPVELRVVPRDLGFLLTTLILLVATNAIAIAPMANLGAPALKDGAIYVLKSAVAITLKFMVMPVVLVATFVGVRLFSGGPLKILPPTHFFTFNALLMSTGGGLLSLLRRAAKLRIGETIFFYSTVAVAALVAGMPAVSQGVLALSSGSFSVAIPLIFIPVIASSYLCLVRLIPNIVVNSPYKRPLYKCDRSRVLL